MNIEIENSDSSGSYNFKMEYNSIKYSGYLFYKTNNMGIDSVRNRMLIRSDFENKQDEPLQIEYNVSKSFEVKE